MQGSFILNAQVIEYYNPSFKKMCVHFNSKTTNNKIIIDYSNKEDLELKFRFDSSQY